MSSDLMSYAGPRDGKGSDEYMSINWCGGQVTRSVRSPEYPLPDRYSRAVAKRILKGTLPKKKLAELLPQFKDLPQLKILKWQEKK